MSRFKRKCRVFLLLLQKNYFVRKRHWIRAILLQLLIPICFPVLAQVFRNQLHAGSKAPKSDTYHKMVNDFEILDHNISFVAEDESSILIRDYAKECLHLPSSRTMEFERESEALEAYLKAREPNSTESHMRILMVVFEKGLSPNKFKYKIRMEHDLWITPNLYSGNSEYVFMKHTPFVQLQRCLDMAFINKTVEGSFVSPEFSVQEMPSPPVEEKIDDIIRQSVLGSLIIFTFLVNLIVEANFVANEKSIGVHVLMAMNGVSTVQNLFSWFVSGAAFCIFYVTPITFILTMYPFPSEMGSFFSNSDVFLIWSILFIHAMHVLSFGIHIASYFSRSLFVTFVTLVLYIGTSIATTGSTLFSISQYLGIIFPNLLLKRAFEEINIYEMESTGLHWDNLFNVRDPNFTFIGNVGMTMILSLIATFLHFFMAVYIHEVKPGKFGVAKHPLYFLKNLMKKPPIVTRIGKLNYENMDGEPFEPAPDTYFPGIQIRNLKKSYSTRMCSDVTIQALKGVSVDFYKNHITSLLGHNGAGKTTMMSILTGMTSPSEGVVLINGQNISENLGNIINDIGLCPQEDMLFPDLDVFEQLFFFGKLKRSGVSNAEMSKNVENLLKKLNMPEKRKTLPAKLSGGQKRRVCLGMALIGDARTLILDEPTSGMDPESRREAWDIILESRARKTILISTHDMEEANVLGDRIAILHSGTLRCDGTTLFLKKLYGQGNVEVTLSTESNCNPRAVLNALNPSGKIVSIDGARLVLNVPSSDNLPDALDYVEARKSDLGLTGMSVSLITLEQVFLKIARDNEDEEVDSDTPWTDSSEKVKGIKLAKQRLFALFAKKFTFSRKNLVLLLLTVCLPLIGILLRLNFGFGNDDDSTSELMVHLSMYRDPQTFYFSKENKTFRDFYATVSKSEDAASHDVSLDDSLNHALLKYARKQRQKYVLNVIAAAEFNKTSPNSKANAMYSSQALYGLPISVNLLTNTLLKLRTNDSYSIAISAQPLPKTDEENVVNVSSSVTVYLKTFAFMFFMFLTSTIFVVQAQRELATGIKHLQLMTGVSPITYWASMFLFDFLVFCFVTTLILLLMIVLDLTNPSIFLWTETMIAGLLLLLLAVNILPMFYIMSLWKKSTTLVATIMSLVPIFLYVLEWIVVFVDIPDTFRDILKVVLHLVPHVSFMNGFMAFVSLEEDIKECRNARIETIIARCNYNPGYLCCGLDCVNGECKKLPSYFDHAIFKETPTLLESVVYLCVTFVLYSCILMALEYGVIPKLIAKLKKYQIKSTIQASDEQVKTEKQIVAEEINKCRAQSRNGASAYQNSEKNLFLVYELSKRYQKVLAVREVNFRVKERECFGLLGINGAGKSTTFRMLTNEESPDTGILYLNGIDFKSDSRAFLSQIGYCPQNSAIIATLNVRDHLKLFGLLRGVPKRKISLEVDGWIDKLNLNACAAQPAGTYSGGNKRRLSIAIAMIGNPGLVLLDEPTTGVDPAARRSLWSVIASSQKHGQSIILTSHSMEECEALCNRLVIMVKGELVCIGPSQQLKQRFGAGFDIQIKLRSDETLSAIADMRSELESMLPCKLSDENSGLLTYHVNGPLTWRTMYNVMNVIQHKHSCIEDYTIISATLEQLFLQFARAAKD